MVEIKYTWVLDAMNCISQQTFNSRLGKDDYYKKYKLGRRDIFMSQVWNEGILIANVFYGINGFEQMDIGGGVELNQEAKGLVRKIADADWQKVDTAYIEAHKNYFARIDGLA